MPDNELHEVPDLRPVDGETLDRMLRFAVANGATRIHFRTCCRPLTEGIGGTRSMRFRQLAREDIESIAGHLLARTSVPERLRDTELDAAQPIAMLVEMPGKALFEAHVEPDGAGLALAVDVIRPIRSSAEIDFYEL